MTQFNYDQYLLDKYGTYEKLNDVHHHETIEVKDGSGVTIVKEGNRVASDYTVEYFDGNGMVTLRPAIPVTNFEYEDRLQRDKRNIFVLKQRYLNIVRDDLEDIMTYKKGSSQFKTESMKVGDNIRLFQ